MRRGLVLFGSFVLCLFLLTGCGKKSAIDTSKFRSITEANGFSVINDYDSYEIESYNSFCK